MSGARLDRVVLHASSRDATALACGTWCSHNLCVVYRCHPRMSLVYPTYWHRQCEVVRVFLVVLVCMESSFAVKVEYERCPSKAFR